MGKIKNECAFCEEPITPKDKKVVVAFVYKPVFFGFDNDQMTLEAVDNSIGQIAHEDCWRGRNGFAPARRRVLKINTGTKGDYDDQT